MDELEKLRKMLETTSGTMPTDGDSIAELVKTRSLNSIERLQRNILIETIIGTIAAFVFLAALIIYPFNLAGVYMLLPVIFFILSFLYYGWKYYGMKKLEVLPDKSIKQYLEKMVEWIAGFSDLYLRLSLVLMPFAILVTVIVTYNINNPDGIFNAAIFENFNPLLVISALFLLACTVTLLFYPVVKWYTGKMFGTHITRLRESLKELQENVAD